MDTDRESMYYKGYIAGYRAGIAAAEQGNLPETNDELLSLPIETMQLSSRARNCLTRAGCRYILDVVSLSAPAIASMRNLGSKSASEIAGWLDQNGVCYSPWSKYL